VSFGPSRRRRDSMFTIKVYLTDTRVQLEEATPPVDVNGREVSFMRPAAAGEVETVTLYPSGYHKVIVENAQGSTTEIRYGNRDERSRRGDQEVLS